MFRNLTIRKRIMLILALVYVISLSLAVTGGYYVLRQDTIREAEQKTAIFAAAMSSAGKYLTGEIRPKVEKLLPNTYFPEATVGIMMLTQTARYVQQTYPEYIFRIASPNPLDPDNLANATESKIIDGFDQGDFDQWKGFVKRDGKSYYAVATPLVATANCIWCHDTPQRANPEMVAQYGTHSGYGYVVGDVVGGRFIYVPTEVALKEARRKLAYFAGGFSLFFLLALLAVDRIIIRSVVKPIEDIVAVATDISRGKMDREFEVKNNDEIKALADAFKRMKVSLAKAMDILRE
jgi:HAMP domain-containing protein